MTQTAYSTSKFAVRGFTESLCNELEETSETVRATCVHPGAVKTNIARNTKPGGHENEEELAKLKESKNDFDKLAKTTPEAAAKQIIAAVEKRQRRLLIGGDAKFFDKIQRLLPSRYNPIFVWIIEKSTGKKVIG